MMNSQSPPPSPARATLADRYASLLTALFTTFRLVFIPAATLTHTAHGPIWIGALLGLLLTFGGEWLTRRAGRRLTLPRQDLVMIMMSLVLLGLLPEETPVTLILWSGIGLAWGEYARSISPQRSGGSRRLGYVLGVGIGLTGLIGPGTWIVAILLIPQLCVEYYRDELERNRRKAQQHKPR